MEGKCLEYCEITLKLLIELIGYFKFDAIIALHAGNLHYIWRPHREFALNLAST